MATIRYVAKMAYFAWALMAVGTTVSIFAIVDYYSGLLGLPDYLPRDYVLGPCYKPLAGCGISISDAFNVVVLFTALATVGLVLLYLDAKKNRIRKTA